MYRVVNLPRTFTLGLELPAPLLPKDPVGTPAPQAPVPAPAPATPETYHCPTQEQLQAVQAKTGYMPPGGQGAFAVGVDPTLNCMRDARGNTICSDGMHYPPGCPHTPPEEYFTPGITPDVTTNGRIEGQIPPPRGGGSAPATIQAQGTAAPSSGPSPWLMAGAGAIGAGLLATGAYFLWLRK